MEISGDEIAEVVLKEFAKWPKKRKPSVRREGLKEWVPLSGIVAQGSTPLRRLAQIARLISGKGTNGLTCVAAATGMKCLPQNKIAQAHGVTLHDWHAEIFAIRTFNRFLMEECRTLALSEENSSEYVRFRSQEERTETHFQPFALKDDICFHMYCSEAPCGDASMELTMAAQSDSTPWELPDSTAPGSFQTGSSSSMLHGRGYFSALGAVRSKPSRPDAPPTLSKSCSDKLALKQATSLLSSLASILIFPSVYLSTLIIPSSQFTKIGCHRAFSSTGRLSVLQGKDWGNGYSFRPFNVITTEKEFAYSRRQLLQEGENLVPSNIASTWTTNWSETVIGGTLQGGKQFSNRGACRVCAQRSWKLALEVAQLVSLPMVEECLGVDTYKQVKEEGLLKKRREVKEYVKKVALSGWTRNDAGEWKLDGVQI